MLTRSMSPSTRQDLCAGPSGRCCWPLRSAVDLVSRLILARFDGAEGLQVDCPLSCCSATGTYEPNPEDRVHGQDDSVFRGAAQIWKYHRQIETSQRREDHREQRVDPPAR